MPEPAYHLAELAIARDPSRPEHILPDLSASRIGIVDVGCGIGQLFVALAGIIPSGVPRFGYDIDQTAIDYANQNWPEQGRFAVAPAEALPLPDGAVDFYVSRVTWPLADMPNAAREAARVLVSGGQLWVTLHPARMILGHIARAARGLHLKGVIVRCISFVNGLTFHFLGSSRRLFGIRDSWQTRSRIHRVLEKAGFENIRITRTARHFLVEATRR